MVVFLDVASLEPSEGFCETSVEMADVNESAAGPSSPRAPTTLSEDSQSISVTAPETAASDGSGDVGAQPTRSPANGDRMSVAAMVTPTGSPKPSSTPERQANPQRAEIKDDDGPKGAGGKRGTSNGAAEEGKSAPSQPSEEVDRSAEETERDTKVTDGSDGEVDRQIPGSEKEGREDADQDEGHEGDDGDDNEGDDGGEDEGEDVNDDSEEEEEEEEEEDDDDDDASDSGSEDDSRSVSRESAMEGVEATEAEGKRESGTAEPSQEKGDAEMDHEKGSDEGKDAGEVATEEAGGHIAAPKPKPKKKRRITPSLEPAPQGPPPRPTVRLALIVSHDDDSEYMANVPVEVYKHLKAKNDPYAAWFEESKGISSALAQEEAEQERGSQRPDLSEFGDLARLLEKYPVDKGNKKRKRAGPDDEYDVRDPFVDDSELNVDEPTHSAKPSSDGFFVTEGPVELAQMKRSKQLANKASGASNGGAAGSGGSGGGLGGAKRSAAPVFTQPVDGIGGVGEIMIEHPSSKVLPQVNILLHRWAVYTGAVHPQPPPPVAQAQVDGSGGREAAEGAGAMGVSSLLNGPNPSESPVRFDGTRQSPIKVDDDDGDPRRPAPPLNDGRKASRYPTIPVDLKLQEAFDNLRQQIARESWLNKAKFPPALKPPLVNVAMLAIDLGEYTDNFFNHLPQLFPYNRFTMQVSEGALLPSLATLISSSSFTETHQAGGI